MRGLVVINYLVCVLHPPPFSLRCVLFAVRLKGARSWSATSFPGESGFGALRPLLEGLAKIVVCVCLECHGIDKHIYWVLDTESWICRTESVCMTQHTYNQIHSVPNTSKAGFRLHIIVGTLEACCCCLLYGLRRS